MRIPRSLGPLPLADVLHFAELTFIIHRRDPSIEPRAPEFLAAHDNSTMIGDVNIFLSSETPPSSDAEDDKPAALASSSLSTSPSSITKLPPARDTRRAEVEIMLAPLGARRRGFALSTLRIFLLYASRTLSLPPSAFFARIGTANTGSIALFEKLGFKRGKVVEVFQEMEMNWGGGEGGNFGWEGKEEYTPLDDPAEELQQPKEEP